MARMEDHANHNMMDMKTTTEMDHAAMGHDMAGTEETMKMNHAGHDMSGAKAGHDMSGMSGMSHMMSFHFGTNATVLFSFWKVTSWQGILGSWVAIFILSILYEGLKVVREQLLRRSNLLVKYNSVPAVVSGTDEAVNVEGRKSLGARMLSVPHFIQSLLHIVQIVFSYFLMLIFMTYNVWLCSAVALGAGVGYFLFSWKRVIVVDINDHCH